LPRNDHRTPATSEFRQTLLESKPLFEIGNSLREARLRQALEFPQIEQATKIRSKYLRALEEEHFEVLPAQTYVKGFLRSYAEYLGLDGQLYVDEFNSRYVGREVEEEAPLAPRGGGGGWGRRQSPMATSAVFVILGIIGVVTALVIVAWRFGAEEQPRVPLPANAVTPLPARKKAAPLARLVASAAPGKNAYLAVYRGSRVGKPIYEGTLEGGQSRRFVGGKLWVYVFAPANLRLKLNGDAVVVPGRGSGGQRWLLVTPRRVTLAPSPT
jgi:helix-turn-helix protein